MISDENQQEYDNNFDEISLELILIVCLFIFTVIMAMKKFGWC